MATGITDTKVHLLRGSRLASEFDVLGISILAHLLAVPRLFSREDSSIIQRLTIKRCGLLFQQPGKSQGYHQAWRGKAFEYAVEELFNNRSEPHLSLIAKAIEDAVSSKRGSRVTSVRLPDIDLLSCIRVCKESPDAEDLRSAFGRFRILKNASISIKGAVQSYSGLEHKVDLLFCDRESEERPQFALLASLKVNRDAFRQMDVIQDFREYPIDFAISVATERLEGVVPDKVLDILVVYLPINVQATAYAWEAATKIVAQALIERERSGFIRFFRSMIPFHTPAGHWVDFLSRRLEADIGEVVEDIRKMLRQPLAERTVSHPVLLGAKEDAVLDLVGS
jgi:hypothetical protein